MKNDNSFMTRQQYRRMKKQNRSFYNRLGRSGFRGHRKPNLSNQNGKIQRLSKRLNKIIAVIILLIIIVYLILIFVNF